MFPFSTAHLYFSSGHEEARPLRYGGHAHTATIDILLPYYGQYPPKKGTFGRYGPRVVIKGFDRIEGYSQYCSVFAEMQLDKLDYFDCLAHRIALPLLVCDFIARYLHALHTKFYQRKRFLYELKFTIQCTMADDAILKQLTSFISDFIRAGSLFPSIALSAPQQQYPSLYHQWAHSKYSWTQLLHKVASAAMDSVRIDFDIFTLDDAPVLY